LLENSKSNESNKKDYTKKSNVGKVFKELKKSRELNRKKM